MPDVDKLPLEDVLEDSPQTRSLVSVFEEDAKELRKYVEGLQEKCECVLRAERDMSAALAGLSQHLLVYEKQKFPVEGDSDSILLDTLHQFAGHAEEAGSWHQSLAAQLRDCVLFPLTRFLETDLREASVMEESFKAAQVDLERAHARYARLGRRRTKDDAGVEDEVYVSRRKFHRVGLHYFRRLNLLQLSRKLSLLEPLLGYMQALRTIFCVGHNVLSSKDMDDFLVNIHACVQGAYDDLRKESQESEELIDSIVAQSDVLYHTQLPAEVSQSSLDSAATLSKAGHLFVRTKYMGVVANWERCYLYTEAGHLMCIGKGEVGGCPLLELGPDTTAHAMQSEERRWVFQVSSGSNKKSVVLQAMNERDRDEWIVSLLNISHHGGYVKQEPEKSSTGSILAGMSQFFVDKKRHSKSSPATTPGSPFEMLMPSAPIMFDLPVQDSSPSPDDDSGVKEGPPRRINPFDESGSSLAAASGQPFSKLFTVRFLGSIEVHAERDVQVVTDAIRHIMTARAVHNLFRSAEVLMVVNESWVRLLEPSGRMSRLVHRLSDVTFWTPHQDSDRLFGYVVKNNDTQGWKLSCVVVEANGSGEEIGEAFSAARKGPGQMQTGVKKKERKQTDMDILAAISALEDEPSLEYEPAETPDHLKLLPTDPHLESDA